MKKLLLILAGLMLIFSLAACSQDNEGAMPEEETQTEGTITIKVVNKDDTTTNPVSVTYFESLEQALKEDEGLDVKFELIDLTQGNYAERLNLLLGGGNIPDLIYFQGGDLQVSQQGVLEDLTPYIENSTYLKDIMEPHNIERVKNYPYLLWVKPLAQRTPVIRADWFNELETSSALMDNPTVETYFEFFKEVVEKKPGGSKPGYAITTAGDIGELDMIFNMAFGINQTWMEKADGTYEYSKISQNEKDKLEFYSKLYQEGLLDPQFVTKQWDTKEKAFYDGDAAVVVGTAGKVIDIYNGKMTQVNGAEAELVALPPAKGEYQGFGATDVIKESRGFAIFSQSPYKDTVFQILDYMASPNGQMLDRLGFEGEHYNIVDGEIELTEKYYNEWFARFWEPSAFEPEMELKTPLLGETAERSLELLQEFYTEDNIFLIPDQYVTNWDAMNNLYVEFATDIVSGKIGIDAFDTFVEEWKRAGGDQITEYANEYLN
ncbi:extracellular solute-binding protein [Bacillus horti]|uniref:Aldouronate transport system substrate-binding protein n=1 Tax=Caldalkalibacillus horti TaxID=77523 RepID=A0ABT9W3M5_9BACI|nr:extracellular solute-binding protein [Bacillus horti]MDQ0167674.1 putative aldouronate transport system substrate-binding protein [Bacillus horti]